VTHRLAGFASRRSGRPGRIVVAMWLLAAVVGPVASLSAQETIPEVMAEAERLREAARDIDAHKRVPLTYGQADSLYAEARDLFESDPTASEEAARLAGAAAREFERAARLAPLADSIRSGKVSAEQVLLRGEAYLGALSEALELTPRLEEGLHALAASTLDEVSALHAEHRRLTRDLEERSAEAADLTIRLDTLQAKLAELERREAEAAAELRRRQDVERRLREVRAVFDPEEAEVVATDDQVTIRLSGLDFASGSAELDNRNAPLLTKLERVVREFPESRITVEGHTDNVGDDAANQVLSRRRAIAVRDYLLASVAMSANRITAVGFGKDRPIAPNDTAEGRRRNRRIDVTIYPGG
jgi:outer membrane protein OmpA-like peptidoglycan-associated protein